MKRDSSEELKKWMMQGGNLVGQIKIQSPERHWELLHTEDAGAPHLTSYQKAEDARMLANYDDKGNYRPLKTAPNLRHGWILKLTTLQEVKLALDYFYPGMIGIWLAQNQGQLAPVHLRATLNRQSGMYRITQKLTDEQADELIAKTCCTEHGCLKTILWQIDSARPVLSLPKNKFHLSSYPENSLPLICHEACNILVAEARKLVKSSTPPSIPSQEPSRAS